MSVKEWDPKGRYKDVVDKVQREAGENEVLVFRIEAGRARVEYWVVGVAKDGGRVVGVKARAVES